MLSDHGRMVVAAASQVGGKLGVRERVCIDRLQFPVCGDGGGFAVLVPITKLLAPEFIRDYLFSALNALVFEVSFLIGLFMVPAFDLWPLTKFPGVMKQPVLGIVWTLIALLIGSVAFFVGVGVLKMDVMAFLIAVTVPYIFGTIVVLNMLQNSLFGGLNQPVKGIANVIAVVVIGSGLAQLYRALMPMITGALQSGPPTYDAEVWTASALLSVTFPFLIFYAEFFKFWPLRKSE